MLIENDSRGEDQSNIYQDNILIKEILMIEILIKDKKYQ